jgi:tRNA (cmo5U34)-methyltransferase
MDSRKSAVRDHFEGEAPVFDELILRLIPDYRGMIEALVRSLPFAADAPIRVIDLGCGTGTVGRCVSERFPSAQVTCMDVAEAMIAAAREKLSACARPRFLVGDFAAGDLGGPYEAVVSSLALHHIEDAAAKLAMYRRIHAALAPGGVFVNADVVLGGDERLSAHYVARWAEWMAGNVGWDEVRSKWMPTYEAEDRPARLLDHLDWLRTAGFAGVDVIWKRDNFAVFSGTRC